MILKDTCETSIDILVGMPGNQDVQAIAITWRSLEPVGLCVVRHVWDSPHIAFTMLSHRTAFAQTRNDFASDSVCRGGLCKCCLNTKSQRTLEVEFSLLFAQCTHKTSLKGRIAHAW